MMTDATPTTVSEANSRLAAIFPSLEKDQQVLPEILSLLRAYPELAAERYSLSREENLTPLAIFVLVTHANSKLKIAKHLFEEIYQLYPKAISERQGKQEELPLHFACKRCSMEIIQFLAEMYPKAISTPTKFDNLPLDYVLVKLRFASTIARSHQLQVLSYLMNMYPEYVTRKQKARDFNTLETVINEGYPVEILERLLDFVSPTLHQVHLKGSDVDRSKLECIFKRLLPQLTELQWQPHFWREDSFLKLLQMLSSSDTTIVLETLTLSLPQQQHLHVTRERNVLKAIQCLLQNNTRLQHLTLKRGSPSLIQRGAGSSRDDDDDGRILQSLADGLQHNPTLESLTLCGFQTSIEKDSALLDLVACAPPTLRLHNCHITGSSTLLLSTKKRLEESRLQQIELSSRDRGSIQREASHDLLLLLSRIPALQSVDWNCHHSMGIKGTVNITAALTELVQQTAIHRLIVGGTKMDSAPLCRALRENTTLKHFSYHCLPEHVPTEHCVHILGMLEAGNTTLQHVYISNMQNSKYNGPIVHLARLNQFGRKHVRDPETTVAELVVLLSALVEEMSLPTGLDECNVRYGLLRERPELWGTIV